MNSFMDGGATGSWVWLHIHWVFWGVAMFGFVAGIVWLTKHAKKDTVMNVMIWAIVIGILGGLLTTPVSMRGWYDMMAGFGGHHGMMDDDEHGVFMDEMMERHLGTEKTSN